MTHIISGSRTLSSPTQGPLFLPAQGPYIILLAWPQDIPGVRWELSSLQRSAQWTYNFTAVLVTILKGLRMWTRLPLLLGMGLNGLKSGERAGYTQHSSKTISHTTGCKFEQFKPPSHTYTEFGVRTWVKGLSIYIVINSLPSYTPFKWGQEG